LSKSFAGLARTAEKEKSVVAVSKEPLESPPLEIYKLGNRVLRERAKRISKVDESTRELARNMLRSMYSAKGIGLAAPQVGIHKQILVIDLDYENSTSPPIVLINPEIQIFGSSIDTYEEGCLSIPGVYLDVVRPSSVKISYRDEMGRPKKMSADGLLGRCIQHEIDHLNGVLFIDRVKDVEARDNALTEQGYKIEDIKEIK
tara:strand:- start:3625 stop:4230 length:606 start_codon:yes stop_codon:yes gene_type:complete